MGVPIHWNNLKNTNVVRECFVEPKHQVEIPFIIKIEVEVVLAGMNHRIGSPATNTGYGLV
jgi:hypothetical protein